MTHSQFQWVPNTELTPAMLNAGARALAKECGIGQVAARAIVQHIVQKMLDAQPRPFVADREEAGILYLKEDGKCGWF